MKKIFTLAMALFVMGTVSFAQDAAKAAPKKKATKTAAPAATEKAAPAAKASTAATEKSTAAPAPKKAGPKKATEPKMAK